ncbi:MAG: methyltransferase domain-containing protein [Acidimicrobiia bacterium]|nr:methyltransferase domain-containing protein [Acidimicrobiia bacterium]
MAVIPFYGADDPTMFEIERRAMDRPVSRDKPLPWVRGDAEHLPFFAAAVDGAYASWAYFFTSGGWDPTPGLNELHRVVKPGGPLLIVDNLGDDEFSAYVEGREAHCADIDRWQMFGFDCEVVDTVFAFDDLDEARMLLGFFFGEAGRSKPKLEVGFRVGLFIGNSAGV